MNRENHRLLEGAGDTRRPKAFVFRHTLRVFKHIFKPFVLATAHVKFSTAKTSVPFLPNAEPLSSETFIYVALQNAFELSPELLRIYSAPFFGLLMIICYRTAAYDS